MIYPNKKGRHAATALVFIAHGIQCRTLKYLQIVKCLLPVICEQTIQQRIYRLVSQADSSGHADLPLCSESTEQHHNRPVFRPYLDVIAVEVLRRQSYRRQLCC